MNAETRAQNDRWEITQLIYRYAARMDVYDIDGVVECFAPDAYAEYGGGATVMRGWKEIGETLGTASRGGMDLPPPSTHLMTNVLIELDGDTARAQMTAVAFRTHVPGSIIVRGLRYADECVRLPKGWVFSSRKHTAIWEFTVPGDVIPPFVGTPV